MNQTPTFRTDTTVSFLCFGHWDLGLKKGKHGGLPLQSGIVFVSVIGILLCPVGAVREPPLHQHHSERKFAFPIQITKKKGDQPQ